MLSLEIFLLGVALAVDAAIVSFTVGLMHVNHPMVSRLSRGVLVSGLFGLFQFLMLWIGSYLGYMFTFSNFGHYFQLVVALIFVALAVKLVQESFGLEEKKIEWGLLPISILAVATSLDALAAGVSLGTLPNAHFAAAEVGVITFILCGVFYSVGHFFHKIPVNWLLRFGALIFISLSGHVLWGLRHFFFRG